MTPSKLRGKNVTVVGAARSGVAVARLLHAHGAEVFVTDAGSIEPAFLAALNEAGIAFESGGHSDRAVDAHFLVTSPGVPSSAPLLQRATGAGLSVYSEIEVASWFCRAPVLAVTGTNGKTTTVSLLGHMFRQAGRKDVCRGQHRISVLEFCGVGPAARPGCAGSVQLSTRPHRGVSALDCRDAECCAGSHGPV